MSSYINIMSSGKYKYYVIYSIINNNCIVRIILYIYLTGFSAPEIVITVVYIAI